MSRSALVSLMEWSTQPHIAEHIVYPGGSVPFRPIPLLTVRQLEARFAKGGHVGWDCFGYTKWLYWASHNRSPDGNRFGIAEGNTETCGEYLRDTYTDDAKVLPGAIGLYGYPELPSSGQHAVVAMVAGGGWVASMGSSNGPLKVQKRFEDEAHRGASFRWHVVGGLMVS